jgi:branched-chain amino acid transport system permease protein/urea transport system permease protein
MTAARLLDAVSVSMILALLALGLSVTFGLMGVINLAHGDLFMCGMYVVVALQPTLGFWLSMLAVVGIVGLLGATIHEGVVRWLWKRPLETLLATWGAGMVIREVVKLVFGSGFRQVSVPLSGQLTVGSLSYSHYRLLLIAITVVVLLAAYLALYRTRSGLYVRAMLNDRETATAFGVRAHRVNLLTFAIGAGLAGVAGALTAPLVTVQPDVGFSYLAQAFFVVIVGGAGRLGGLLAGGALIGGGVVLASNLINPTAAQVIVLLFAIAVMRFRPQGLVPA